MVRANRRVVFSVVTSFVLLAVQDLCHFVPMGSLVDRILDVSMFLYMQPELVSSSSGSGETRSHVRFRGFSCDGGSSHSIGKTDEEAAPGVSPWIGASCSSGIERNHILLSSLLAHSR